MFVALGIVAGWVAHDAVVGKSVDIGADPSLPSAAPSLPVAVAEPAAPPLDGGDLPPGITDPVVRTRWEALREKELEAALHPAADWPHRVDLEPGDGPRLRSRAWYVYDHESGEVLTSKWSDIPLPIASISKLAAALVWADAGVPDDTELELQQEDKDFIQVTRSRLRVGAKYRAIDLLHSSLLSSDNRATAALMRSTGLGRENFVAAMNRRMEMLGLATARFGDPTGLDPLDIASARDVGRLLDAALAHPRLAPVLLKTEHRYQRVDRNTFITTRSSNRLTHQVEWGVVASKTGYTDEAGSCLVMRAWMHGHPVTVALLGARGVHSRYGDSVRIREWVGSRVGGGEALASLGGHDLLSGLFRPWPDDGLLPPKALLLQGEDEVDEEASEAGAEDELGGP